MEVNDEKVEYEEVRANSTFNMGYHGCWVSIAASQGPAVPEAPTGSPATVPGANFVDEDGDGRCTLAGGRQGYGPRGQGVFTAANGREALFAARDHKPDLIVLNLMMPEMDGWEFLRLHRQERNTPIIMLAACVDDADKIAGL